MKNPLSRLLLASAAMAPLFAANVAQAQAAPPDMTIEEVVVTATKTGAQQLQKTPDAISVVTGKQLDSQGVHNIKDLAQFIPNVTFAQNTASAEIYIRGIGSNNVAAGSDPDVTTQIDGVYIARPSGQFADFLDVQNIEILRGPQGTLYGRNAVGGTINVISRTPSAQFGGKAELTAGNYGLAQGGLYMTGPLASDQLLGSIALNYTRHDAYFHNIAPGGHDVGEANRGGVKAQLRWQPSADLDATTRLDLAQSDEYFESYSHLIAPVPFPSLANTLVGSYRDVALNDPQRMRTQIGGISEEVNWRLGGGWSLKSITAFRSTKYKFTNDNDSTEQAVQFSHQQERDRQYSQEFNLLYAGERLKGLAGVYLFSDNDHQANSVNVSPSAFTPASRALFNSVSPQIDSNSAAVFAQGSYEITPTLTATVGARYTAERKTMDQAFTRLSLNPATPLAPFPGFPLAYHLSNDYHAFTPKFGLDWQVSADAMIYASVTRGYKSGGFNFSSASPATAAFQPEEIWSYEGGAKTEWLDRRLRLNATAFHYDYSNLQVQQLISAGVQSIGNAATATVTGVELELVAKPTPALQITANVSALNAKYDKYPGASVPAGLAPYVPNQTCVAGTCTIDASGHYLNSAPRFSGMLAVDYTHEVMSYRLATHLDYAWRDRTYYDPSNAAVASQGSYGLLNAQIALGSQDEAWSVQLWARNLTNQTYYVTTGVPGVAPAGLSGDPRTFGVRLTRDW